MAANVTLGDARAKSKTAHVHEGQAGDLYACELPLLVNGTERGQLQLSIFVPGSMTNAQVAAWLGAPLTCRWFASPVS